MEEVKIDKLVFGGQGLGTLPDGRKIFVWNTLPGETVRARIITKKKSYLEAIVEEIVVPSKERVKPEEDNFLATSPWQIMTKTAENKYKKSITKDMFDRAKVKLPAFKFKAAKEQWNYRNKMEYSFWGDDDGIHLALHMRGSKFKQIVNGSKLALPAVDAAAQEICRQLTTLKTRAGDVKTVIIRVNQKGEAVASLFTKLEKFKQLELSNDLKGMRVYFSDPRSPASVQTRLLYEIGDVLLEDTLLEKPFIYDVDSFFQVNPPMFEMALKEIQKRITEAAVTDMYAGVGSIGLSLGVDSVNLIEIDPATVRMASQNASQASEQMIVSVIGTSTEKSLDYITSDKPVIFDPPRAGLHDKVVERVLEVLPPKVIYLSCNPSTQVRDLSKLQEKYTFTFFESYNFFPRTPHIETLAVLELSVHA